MKTLAFIMALLIPVAVSGQVVTGSVTGQLLPKEGQTIAGVRISAMAVPDGNIAVAAFPMVAPTGVTVSGRVIFKHRYPMGSIASRGPGSRRGIC